MEQLDPHLDEKLQRLGGVARDLRASLVDPDTDVVRREIDLYAYDEVLVTMADMVEVEVPASVRDEMGPDDRAQLEAELAAAGIDLGSADGGGQPAGS